MRRSERRRGSRRRKKRRSLRAADLWFVAIGAALIAVAIFYVDPDPDRADRPLAALTPHAHPAGGHARFSARGHLRPGSDPSVLPGNVLIADRGNDRLIEVDPRGRTVWTFPRKGDLGKGETFHVPDDAFFTRNGRRLVATEEDDFTISVIDMRRHRIVYRYGRPGVSGAADNRVWNPDDALPTPKGQILSADIKNCRLIVMHPPGHRLVRQLGTPGACFHDPPRAFGSPNGAFPLRDGGTVVTEITGDWIDVLDRRGRLVSATHAPGFSYPSDTNEFRRGLLVSVDYANPGAIAVFDRHGRTHWRYAPKGDDALDRPSLAMRLPNGDVLANDDYNHRVIVVDPRTSRIVWQYGHTGVPGHRAGYLNIPDGVDLAPPYSLMRRFPHMRPPR